MVDTYLITTTINNGIYRMGDYAQHQQSNHQLKILLATLDNTLLHKINEFLFFGKKPKEKKNHNDSNNLTLPTTITFQQLMIMLSYNLYIYMKLIYHIII